MAAARQSKAALISMPYVHRTLPHATGRKPDVLCEDMRVSIRTLCHPRKHVQPTIYERKRCAFTGANSETQSVGCQLLWCNVDQGAILRYWPPEVGLSRAVSVENCHFASNGSLTAIDAISARLKYTNV